MLLEIALGYLLAKKRITFAKSLIIAIIGGVIISALATMHLDMHLERAPFESSLQFLSGSLLSPTLTLLARYFISKVLHRMRLKRAYQQTV